jgi:uncharacterized protein (UPF0332 family)
MRAGQKHPPKKKHVTKPRPEPRSVLSEREKALRARLEFAKGLVHLREALELAGFARAPNACVHAAYYAMHHTARAALFANGGVGKTGDVPLSHEHVIEHFGKLVSGEAGELGRCGLLLTRARTDRTVGDYDLIRNPTNAEAAATSADAELFVNQCRARWSLKTPPEDE